MYPCPRNSHPASRAASATREYSVHTEPLIARVGTRLNWRKQSYKRQKPTRIPYSCQAQFGKSGIKAFPMGGGNTARGMGPRMSQCSTLTTGHTTILAVPGNFSGDRSTIAE